jgi:hypothetical protein
MQITKPEDKEMLKIELESADLKRSSCWRLGGIPVQNKPF